MDAQTPNMQAQMPQQMMGQPMMQANQMMGQQMMQGGGFDNDGFSAKPQLIKQKKYRDPYREYM